MVNGKMETSFGTKKVIIDWNNLQSMIPSSNYVLRRSSPFIIIGRKAFQMIQNHLTADTRNYIKTQRSMELTCITTLTHFGILQIILNTAMIVGG